MGTQPNEIYWVEYEIHRARLTSCMKNEYRTSIFNLTFEIRILFTGNLSSSFIQDQRTYIGMDLVQSVRLIP